MSTNGQSTTRRRKIAENFNRLNRVHERYSQLTDRRQTVFSTIFGQTDGTAIAYSERERAFLERRLTQRSLKTTHNNCSNAV